MSNNNYNSLLKILSVAWLALLSFSLSGQDNSDQQMDYVQHFRLEDDTSSVNLFLKEKFAETDYLIIGETHYSKQIGEWFKHWAKSWQEMGYTQFLAEVGPISAGKLTELMDYSTTNEYLDFLKKYAFLHPKFSPIPFFDGEEDITFLKELFQHGFTLQGIDQEFVYSFPYLWEELFMAQGQPKAAEAAKSKLEVFCKGAYERKRNGGGYNIYQDFLTNDTILHYYQALGPLNPKAKNIRSAIESSLKIYDAVLKRSLSHIRRIHYIREQTKQILTSNKNTTDKYIIKIGRLHAGKYRQFDAYDVGYLFHERAKAKGQASLHIGFLRGYYQNEEGNISDPTTLFEDYYFRQHASKEQWTLIDLRKYEQGLASGVINLPDSYTQQLILSDLDNFDLLLIPPLDQRQTPLRERTEKK